jgi:hypothetical protein
MTFWSTASGPRNLLILKEKLKIHKKSITIKRLHTSDRIRTHHAQSDTHYTHYTQSDTHYTQYAHYTHYTQRDAQ